MRIRSLAVVFAAALVAASCSSSSTATAAGTTTTTTIDDASTTPTDVTTTTIGLPTGFTLAPADQWQVNSTAHDAGIRLGLSVSPDGRWLGAVVGADEVCLEPLEDPGPIVCVEEVTVGEDTLRWSPDSTKIAPSGSVQLFDNTAAWFIGTDGSSSALSTVEEGSIFDNDDNTLLEISTGAAFRPDGESVVFLETVDEATAVVEIGLNGERSELALIDRSELNPWPLVPLSDGRVIVARGMVEDVGLDLLDDGEWTRLVSAAELGSFFLPAVGVELRPDAEDLVMVAEVTTEIRSANLISDWSIVDFDGNQFPLVPPAEQVVVAAAFSPDGESVGYLTRTEVIQPGVAEFHVKTVASVLEGSADLLGSIDMDFGEVRGVTLSKESDLQFMQWTEDGRVIATSRVIEGQVQLIEIDVSGTS